MVWCLFSHIQSVLPRFPGFIASARAGKEGQIAHHPEAIVELQDIRLLTLSPAPVSLHRMLPVVLRRLPACAARSLRRPAAQQAVPCLRFLSDGGSITYSGGHASDGQGGFYGSGGARAGKEGQIAHHPEAIVELQDIRLLEQVMSEVATLEDQLATSMATHGSSVNEQSIELKAAIKRKMSSKAMAQLLDRLEINGTPRWGLSTKERKLVNLARDKFNAADKPLAKSALREWSAGRGRRSDHLAIPSSGTHGTRTTRDERERRRPR
eukprot:CAMPEP_0118998312 /NCGR_PEP_ID=MMETSP1173-20130426/63009_1 /TAXON_ID=1034831 /ORGANISM="Rhizochromulina marina cf, Strain CCMP1243" /LENGTH=266 /DNA_ID=CAMNT_0006949803 /DNA_START=288 /DNA_END=1089 /DNA_ORIENTATION=-